MKKKNLLYILLSISFVISLSLGIIGLALKIDVLQIISYVLLSVTSLGSISISFSFNKTQIKNEGNGNNAIVAGRDVYIKGGQSNLDEEICKIYDQAFNTLSVDCKIYIDKIIHYLEKMDKVSYLNCINDLESYWRKCMRVSYAELNRNDPKAIEYKSIFDVIGYFVGRYRGSMGNMQVNEDFRQKNQVIALLKSIKKDIENLKPISH